MRENSEGVQLYQSGSAFQLAAKHRSIVERRPLAADRDPKQPGGVGRVGV
ncbi:MAG: hypothetical protein K2Y23_15200 [Cyanobacteria bacterium]|nr:hypothetical protein [Cyanobacteriota bacterium]